MSNIKEILVELNPWWKGKFRLDYKDREILEKIQKFLKLRQILAFTGLRRIGKTTLMLKIVVDSIQSGFSPQNIVYFSFDEFRETNIRDVIKTVEMMMNYDLKDGKHLLLLDEIQKLDGWEDQLKGIYDSFGQNLKIVISGSESLFIRRKSKETLAGRIFEFKIDPLTFKEFLTFKNIDFLPIDIHGKELIRLFNEFTLSLGFPEMVNVRDKDVIKKYIKESIVEKVIYRDVANLYKVKDISLLESLFNILMDGPGQLIEISNLSQQMNITRQTLSNYFRYLEDSFLIRKLYNYSKGRRKVERKLKKYYPAVISPSLLFKEDDHYKSKVFEWLLVNQLNAEFFWRDPYKNEVDVIKAEKKIIPIEIKYGRIEYKGLLAFMRKFKLQEGYVISFDKEKKQEINGKTIHVIPAFKFLLEQEKFL